MMIEDSKDTMLKPIYEEEKSDKIPTEELENLLQKWNESYR